MSESNAFFFIFHLSREKFATEKMLILHERLRDDRRDGMRKGTAGPESPPGYLPVPLSNIAG